MARYRRLARYARREWPTLGLIVLLTMVASAMAVLQPWPLKVLVDHAFQGRAIATGDGGLAQLVLPESPLGLVTLAALASLAIFLVASTIDLALTWAWTLAGQRMVYALAADLFGRLQRQSLSARSRRTVGDSLDRLTGDTWCVYRLADGLVVTPIADSLRIAALALVAWQLDPVLATVAVATAPVLGLLAVASGRLVRAETRRSRETHASLTALVQQTLGALPMVQVFNGRPHAARRFDATARTWVDASRRSALAKGRVTFLSGATAVVGGAIVLAVGGQRVLDGALTVGSLLVFISYLQTMQQAAQRLVSTYAEFKAVEASLDRVLEVLDADDPVREAANARPMARSAGPAGIGFEHVTAGYEAGRPVLHDVTLDVAPGEVVALVGATGAGKSTLASLVPRFLDPFRGTVRIDGHDVRDLTIASVRSAVSLVLQEPFLLPLSVAENIAYGRPGAARDEIVAAAIAANADAFIRQLPEGYDTVIGERGATLSGGERQRLAIARAVVKNAPILILDEPTSALDVKTEMSVLDALNRLMAGRTTLIVAHRLSTVRRAQRIVVLEGGRSVEIGSHTELLARRGYYSRLIECADRPSRHEVVA